jgi:hypothetical protein
MSSEHWVHSFRLSTHLEWLLAELEPKARAIAALIANGVTIDIFCYSAGRSSKLPSLPRSIRERASALGIPIDIDHYHVDDENTTPTPDDPSGGDV